MDSEIWYDGRNGFIYMTVVLNLPYRCVLNYRNGPGYMYMKQS